MNFKLQRSLIFKRLLIKLEKSYVLKIFLLNAYEFKNLSIQFNKNKTKNVLSYKTDDRLMILIDISRSDVICILKHIYHSINMHEKEYKEIKIKKMIIWIFMLYKYMIDLYNRNMMYRF